MKILIADDSVTIRKIVRANLEKLDITNIIEASNGANALSALRAERDIDFVFTDYNMPVMNGLEFVKKVREDAKLKHTKMILISSESDSKVLDEFRRCGVTRFISKPFSLQKFNEMMSPLLNSSEADGEGKVGVDHEELLRLIASGTPSVKFEPDKMTLDFGKEKLTISIAAIAEQAIHTIELE